MHTDICPSHLTHILYANIHANMHMMHVDIYFNISDITDMNFCHFLAIVHAVTFRWLAHQFGLTEI